MPTPDTSPEQINQAMNHAMESFPRFRSLPSTKRAQLLLGIRKELCKLRDTIISTANHETSLGEIRLTMEFNRTISEIERFIGDRLKIYLHHGKSRGGFCANKKCVCGHGWTGPNCLAAVGYDDVIYNNNDDDVDIYQPIGFDLTPGLLITFMTYVIGIGGCAYWKYLDRLERQQRKR